MIISVVVCMEIEMCAASVWCSVHPFLTTHRSSQTPAYFGASIFACI